MGRGAAVQARIEALTSQVDALKLRIETLEDGFSEVSSQIDDVQSRATEWAESHSAVELTRSILNSNQNAAVDEATRRGWTFTMSTSKHNPDNRLRLYFGFGFGGAFLVILAVAYFIEVARGVPLPKGPILPLLCGISLAFSFGAFTGEAKGTGTVSADAGTLAPAGSGASGRFQFGVTGSLVGFVLGVIAGIVAIVSI
jgi:hypothetical protein